MLIQSTYRFHQEMQEEQQLEHKYLIVFTFKIKLSIVLVLIDFIIMSFLFQQKLVQKNNLLNFLVLYLLLILLNQLRNLQQNLRHSNWYHLKLKKWDHLQPSSQYNKCCQNKNTFHFFKIKNLKLNLPLRYLNK